MAKRTYTLISRDLNPGKRAILADLVASFASERQRWLMELQRPENIPQAGHYMACCANVITRTDYQSPYGLSKRMAKATLRRACMTMEAYWGGILEKCRTRIFKRADWDKDTKKEAIKQLKLENIQTILKGQHGPYLERIVRHTRKAYPVAKTARSLVLDSSLYRVFENNGTLFIAITTTIRGNRLVIPLLGKAAISGDIRVVLVDNHIEVRVCADVVPTLPNPGVIEAIDKGYTEAFMDADGISYGEGLGDHLTKESHWLNRKMQNRHRRHAYEKSLREDNPKKAATIRKHNLGCKKLDLRMYKARTTAERIVNEGLNQFFRDKKPEILISEDLTHSFAFTKGKKINRRRAFWIKRVIASRVEFKALAGGSRHEIVNAAYSSQTCPSCGYVDHNNRKGDVFECQHCGHAGHADHVATKNLLARFGDSHITRYTPYRQVKQILLSRFHRWLQNSPIEGSQCSGQEIKRRLPSTAAVEISEP